MTNALNSMAPAITDTNFTAMPVLVSVGPPAPVAPPEPGLFVVGAVGVDAAEQVGTVFIVSVVVLTVPPNAKALPVHVMVLPMVMPEASISVPWKIVLAPSVVAAPGVHHMLQAEAPPARTTLEFEAEVNAAVILNMYVPPPVRVIPPVPIDTAPVAQ